MSLQLDLFVPTKQPGRYFNNLASDDFMLPPPSHSE